MCDPSKRGKFFQKGDASNYTQSRALFEYVYDTYKDEMSQNTQTQSKDDARSGRSTPSSDAGITSGFMKLMTGDSETEEEERFNSVPDELERYFTQWEGVRPIAPEGIKGWHCSSEELLPWWKVRLPFYFYSINCSHVLPDPREYFPGYF